MLIVGTALAVYVNGIAQGGYFLFIDGATRTWLGQFQVLDGDFNEKPRLHAAVEGSAALARAIQAVPGVQGAPRRIDTAGLLAADRRTTGVALVGVEPAGELRTTRVASFVKRGRWLPEAGDAAWPLRVRQSDDLEVPPMVIGSRVARRLGVDLGNEVSFVGQAADGSMAAENFRIVGLLESGSESVDGALVAIRLSDAQQLFVLGTRVHRVVGTLEPDANLDAVLARLPDPSPHRTLSWRELDPGMYNAIQADRNSGQVMLWVVMLVVVLGVANTLLMNVFERTRELSIMLALGTPPGRVVGIILCEVGLLSGAGVVVGAGIGWVLAELVAIPLGGSFEWAGVVVSSMPGRNTWFGSFWTPVLIFLSSLLSGLWPARRAARLDPLAALR
jgi:ABC-type lipoprotein release transport system permease subunit